MTSTARQHHIRNAAQATSLQAQAAHFAVQTRDIDERLIATKMPAQHIRCLSVACSAAAA